MIQMNKKMDKILSAFDCVFFWFPRIMNKIFMYSTQNSIIV